MRENGSYEFRGADGDGTENFRPGTRVRRWFVVVDPQGNGAQVTLTLQGGQVGTSLAIPAGAGQIEALPGGNQSVSIFDVAGDVLLYGIETVR